MSSTKKIVATTTVVVGSHVVETSAIRALQQREETSVSDRNLTVPDLATCQDGSFVEKGCLCASHPTKDTNQEEQKVEHPAAAQPPQHQFPELKLIRTDKQAHSVRQLYSCTDAIEEGSMVEVQLWKETDFGRQRVEPFDHSRCQFNGDRGTVIGPGSVARSWTVEFDDGVGPRKENEFLQEHLKLVDTLDALPGMVRKGATTYVQRLSRVELN